MSERERLRAVYHGELGVREATGHNDGVRVQEYLAYCNLGPGHDWCAAFLSWCFGQIGRELPRTPWSPSLVPVARRITPDGPVRPGDVFGIYVAEKKRIAHAGFIDELHADGKYLVTVEGNSGNAVQRRLRPRATVRVVADWITPLAVKSPLL